MLHLKKLSLLAIAGVLPLIARAQVVSYLSALSTYTQNFDGLPQTGSTAIATTSATAIQGQLGSTGVNGWYMFNDRGSSTSTEYRAQNGSLSGSAGRGVVSFGTTGNADRALGVLATSNQVSVFGLYLKNDTGSTLTSFQLSYKGEQWRAGDEGIADKLLFKYKIVDTLASASLSGTSGTFTGVSALDLNGPFVPTAGLNNTLLDGNSGTYSSLVSASSAISWGAGQVLILEWVGDDLSGQDSGLAIDNLTFSAVPEPSTTCMLLGAGVFAVVLGRRRYVRAATSAV